MNTPEIEELKHLVEERYGKKLSTTTDFEEFLLMLQRKHEIGVSSSTLKRLYGYVGDSHKPRVQTLDALATYLEFKDYAGFVDWLKTSTRYNSSFFDACQLVSSDLERGDNVEIGWAPNRLLRLEYLGDSAYRVVEAHNSKLQSDDMFVTGCFIKEQPLYLPYIERNGERTPPFVAGRNGGLSIVRKII
mgnify:CR=1 FL=1